MPLILVILDGMTEGGVPAAVPFVPEGCGCLERLTREGGWGVLNNNPPGLPVDSLTCIATLLGVPPGQIPHGRAYLEALAAGIVLGPDDAVCRCNLTKLGPGGELLGACNAAGEADSRALCMALSREGAELFHLSGYRNLLVLRGGAAQAREVEMNAPHEHTGEVALPLLPGGTPLAERIRRVALESRRTSAGGGQMLFPWDIAVKQALPRFAALHSGLTAACVCKTEIVRGLCLAMEMPVTVPEGATADADTNLAAKARAALTLAGEYAVVVLHVNGADELGHRRDAAGKAVFLRRADAELLEPLCAGLPRGGRLLVCPDHGTSASTGGHVGGPQPFYWYEQGRNARGALGETPGEKAVELLTGPV